MPEYTKAAHQIWATMCDTTSVRQLTLCALESQAVGNVDEMENASSQIKIRHATAYSLIFGPQLSWRCDRTESVCISLANVTVPPWPYRFFFLPSKE